MSRRFSLATKDADDQVLGLSHTGLNGAGATDDGPLVPDYPREGTAELDRDIVPIRLPKGTTPILLKITNNLHKWGFYIRLTDPQGRPLKNLKFSLSPG